MKKYLIAVMVIIMCAAFAGCGDSAGTDEAAEPETTAAEAAADETADAGEAQSGPEYTDYSNVKELTSDLGFGMDVQSVGLTPEGEVIMRTQKDLADELGWQFTLESGVKDLYVEEFGNGGFYTILMIKEDGTVSAVNTAKLRDEKTIEIMDEIGGYQDVASIEGTHTEDGSLVYAVMESGDKYMLDPYLK